MHRLLILKRVRHFHCNNYHKMMYSHKKNEMLSENLFSAVKIYGTFKHMHVRMMPAQQPPYTRLIDSARRQPEEKDKIFVVPLLDFYTRIISWRRVCWFSYTFCR